LKNLHRKERNNNNVVAIVSAQRNFAQKLKATVNMTLSCSHIDSLSLILPQPDGPANNKK